MFRHLLLVSFAVSSCASEQRQECTADGECPEEIDTMKVSLLQARRAAGESMDVAHVEDGNQEMAKLLNRKAELLTQLADLEQELQQGDPDEDGVWVATDPDATDDSATKIIVPPASGSAVMSDSVDEEEAELNQLNATQGGTCKSYGCGSYSHNRDCQCNDKCAKYGSCCDDYKSACAANSCATYECGSYSHGRDCQCNDLCADYGSCCGDYETACPSNEVGTPPPTLSAHSGGVSVGSAVNGVFGHPSASIVYPKYPGFTLWLAEEFDEPIDLDNDPIWTWSDGGLREGSVRFVKRGIKFANGKMLIEVSNQKPFPKTERCSHASVENIPYKPLTSGELRSRHNMFRYGRYEVRMKAPEIHHGNPDLNGNFISTMFAYRDANAHHWREIDFEITGDQPNSLTTNLLYADGTKNWKSYLQDSRRPYLGKSINVRKNFHTYMFEWTPKGVIWYVDGKEVRRGSRLRVPEKSTKIMMNLWIFTGGNFGGHQIYNNQYPMHSEYEYFRFYKWDGDKHYPCADATDSCLTEDDKYLSANNPCDGIKQEGLLQGQRPCQAQCIK